MHLLHEEIYYEFAAHFFKEKKGELSQEVFHQLYEQFNGYTWYLQAVLNRLYEREKRVTNYQQVWEAIYVILADKRDQYQMLMTFLTDNQFTLLKAIAKEGIVAQPHSNEFIRKYEMLGSSSVSKAMDVLIEKDIVYRTPEGYIVYDRFLDLWLRRTFV